MSIIGECGDGGVAFPQKSDNVINTKVASGEHEGKVSPDDRKIETAGKTSDSGERGSNRGCLFNYCIC